MTVQHATEDTRTYILERAEVLFGTRGYRGFSMRELAEACGLAKGTLYHHFPSKRDLYLRVLEREALVLRDTLAEAAGPPGTVTERIERVARVYLEYLLQRQYLFHIAIREGGSFEDIRKIFAAHLEEIMAPLVSLIEAGIEGDILRPMDSQLMARALSGMVAALARHRMLSEDVEVDPRELEDMLSLFLDGAILRK